MMVNITFIESDKDYGECLNDGFYHELACPIELIPKIGDYIYISDKKYKVVDFRKLIDYKINNMMYEIVFENI